MRLIVSAPGPESSTAVGRDSLDAPGSPTWTAEFYPLAVSPDGQYVAGFHPGADGLQLRSLANGSVVRELSAPYYYNEPLGTWESDGSVLVTVSVGRSDVVVRCPVTGACELAVPKSPDLSFPDHLVLS
jgi:hypothetical protein